MLLARHERVCPGSKKEVKKARDIKIGFLEKVAWSSQCNGVARYELAHLYDLRGHHVKALALHAINREQYPRFYRGRYRLAMSLEMITNSDPAKEMSKDERKTFNDVLRILDRWDGTPADRQKHHVEDGELVLSPDLRSYLLKAAQRELREIGKYLTPRDVIWQSLRHRNERGVLKPYWRPRHRQSFHDGVCIAQLLVAVRQTLNKDGEADLLPHGLARLLPAVRQAWNKKDADPNDKDAGRRRRGPLHLLVTVRQIMKADPLPRPHKVLRIATAIADDSTCIAQVLGISRYKPGRPWRRGHHPPRMVKRLRTRLRPRQYSTPSWPAAYNLACAYAAICAHPNRPEACIQTTLVEQVVTSLEFAITNPECEMERPWEWIHNDPDFAWLRSHGAQFPKFKHFLHTQKQRDYPDSTTQNGAAAAPASPPNGQPSKQTAGAGLTA